MPSSPVRRLPWKAALALAIVVALVPPMVALAAGLSAMSGARRFAEMVRSDAALLLSGDEEALGRLSDEVRPLAARGRVLLFVGRWVEAAAGGVEWAPIVGGELRGWGGLARRLGADAEATGRLLEGVEALGPALSQAPSLLEGEGLEAVDVLARRSSAATLSFDAALARLADRPAGRPLLLALPPVGGLLEALDEAEARLEAAALAGQQAALLAGDVAQMAAGLAPLLGTDSTALQAERLREGVERAAEAALRAADRSPRLVDAVERLAAESGGATTSVEELARLLGLSAEVAEVARRAVDLSAPVLEALLSRDDADPSALLVSLAPRGEELTTAAEDLRAAAQGLSELADQAVDRRVARAAGSLARTVAQAADALELAGVLAPAADRLLGAEEPVTYLVLGHSADELRATGGFVSALWTIVLDRGRPQSVRYYDAVRVDDWERIDLYPKAPPGLEEHMNAWVWLMRDVSWDPDFPTTAQAARALFRLGQRQEVDGVVGINQWALLSFVEALGSLPLPEGGEVTSLNLLEVLERKTDRYGRAYVDILLQGFLDRLQDPRSPREALALASALYRALESRQLMVYVEDAEAAQVLRRRGWDGALRADASDYLYVVDSNVGWSKSDRSVGRRTAYRVDLGRPERPRAFLTLRYNNYSGPGSPPCEPQWLNRGTDYSQLKNACYWDFLRVYIPLGARLLYSTPLPLPEYSVAVEIGLGTPGEDTGALSAAHGKAVFSGLFPLPAGEQKEISLVYDLPADVLGREGDALNYRLVLQRQPGLRERPTSVELVLPDGYRLATATPRPALDDGSRLLFELDLSRDAVVEVRLERDETTS